MAGLAEFNVVAPGDAITQEQRIDVKPQDPGVDQVATAPNPDLGKRSIQCDVNDPSYIAHGVDTVQGSLDAAAQTPVSGVAELFGGITKTVAEISPAVRGATGMQPAPAADGPQPDVATPDLAAQQQAAILEATNTTWTARASNNMEFKPGGMA